MRNDTLDDNPEERMGGMDLLYAVAKRRFRADEKGSRESFLRHSK